MKVLHLILLLLLLIAPVWPQAELEEKIRGLDNDHGTTVANVPPRAHTMCFD
jgi:hypothetical protein